MPIREWQPNTPYQQGDCVVIPDGSGGYMGDVNGAKTWLLCCVGSGVTPDSTPWGISGATKTQTEWATLFEGTGTDGIVGEGTVMPATLSAGAGPDGNIRWSCGVAYFLDTTATTSTAVGTFAQPYNSASQISNTQISSQDGTNTTRQLYIKRGTVVRLTSNGAQWLGRGGSRKARARITDYGPTTLEKPLLDASLAVGLAGVYIFKAAANPATWVEVSNIQVHNAGGDGVSVFLGTSDAGIVQSNIFILGVEARYNGASGIQALTGGNVDRSTSSTNIVIEDCVAEFNNVYGIAVREWWDGIRIIRPRCKGNGRVAPVGSYAVSTIGNYQTYTVSGWSDLGGNLWQRVFTRTNNVIDGRIRRADGSERALTVGTFGALVTPYTIANSGGTVQVLLGPGDTPNNFPVWVCYNRVKNIVIRDVTLDSQLDLRSPESVFDGDGIGIDQFSENVYVRGGRITAMAGCGLLTNQPNNIRVEGLVITGNGATKLASRQTVAGIIVSHPRGSTIRVANNTIVDNAGDGVMVYSPNAGTVDVRNNLIVANTGAGLRGTATVSVVSPQGNRIFGNGSTVVDVTLSGSDNTSSTAGLVNTDLTIPGTAIVSGSAVVNPLATQGVWTQGLRVYNGRPRPGRTPVGAYLPSRRTP